MEPRTNSDILANLATLPLAQHLAAFQAVLPWADPRQLLTKRTLP